MKITRKRAELTVRKVTGRTDLRRKDVHGVHA